MKAYYILTAFILLFTSTSRGQVPDSLKFKSLPPAEFLEAYQKSLKGELIDVREFFEYKESRLKDAVNIPSFRNLDISADTIDKSKELFFYCTSGFRSKRVAKFFFDKGFPKVNSLDGGIMAWRKEKFPVEKKRLRANDSRHTEE